LGLLFFERVLIRMGTVLLPYLELARGFSPENASSLPVRVLGIDFPGDDPHNRLKPYKPNLPMTKQCLLLRTLRSLPPTLLLVSACAVLSGCAGRSFVVGVSGFADANQADGTRYWLLPGNPDSTPEDLEFREYSRYLHAGLAQAGFQKAPSLEEADLAIFASYGLGDKQQDHYSYSLPIYGRTGGGAHNFSATTYSGTRSAHTYGTVYTQPTYGVVGSQQISGTSATYLRHLDVDAFDNRLYQTEKKMACIWQIQVLSRGSSDDLRLVFPALVTAAVPHFGKSTEKQLRVTIGPNSSRLRDIKVAAAPHPAER
jgi:hypothetical protein